MMQPEEHRYRLWKAAVVAPVIRSHRGKSADAESSGLRHAPGKTVWPIRHS